MPSPHFLYYLLAGYKAQSDMEDDKAAAAWSLNS